MIKSVNRRAKLEQNAKNADPISLNAVTSTILMCAPLQQAKLCGGSS